MRVGVVGCGFVFDLYMATWEAHPNLQIAGVWDLDPTRREAVQKHYGLHAYGSLDAMLADPEIAIVANFTPLHAHVPVTLAALEAGKHVYCEKPLAPSMEEAKEAFRLAERKGLRLSVAPANALSVSFRTLQAAVEDGLIGTPRLVYAEFDDGPIHLMRPEGWVSPSGASWPLLEEYTTGCTLEHVGYHLSWICALLGPVESLTAFSSVVTPQKTDPPLSTPDFSVACLQMASGAAARITCSIAGPRDHRLRVIGETGMLSLATYKDYRSPVLFDRFDWHRLSVRGHGRARNNWMRWLLGAEDRILPEQPGAGLHASADGRMDMAAGIAELADAIRDGRPHVPGHDVSLHLTELTLAIHAAGPGGATHRLETSFDRPAAPERRPETALRPIARPSRRQVMAERARTLLRKKRRLS